MKIAVFVCLIKLIFHSRFTKKADVTTNFANLNVTSPGASLLSFLLKEKFVFEEYYIDLENAKPVIIDGGANIGVSVLYFKTIFPDSTIFAFEPNPESFNYLKKNTVGNGLEGVVLEQVALTGVARVVSLNTSKDNPYLNASITPRSAGTMSVNAVQLSSYLQRLNHVDLIKLDVEGEEFEIIKDLYESKVLDKVTVDNFIVEYHKSYLNNQEKLPEFIWILEEMGYNCKNPSVVSSADRSDILLIFSR
jgi:FkbM family methyltransferase